jgi:hypothetical protein
LTAPAQFGISSVTVGATGSPSPTETITKRHRQPLLRRHSHNRRQSKCHCFERRFHWWHT